MKKIISLFTFTLSFFCFFASSYIYADEKDIIEDPYSLIVKNEKKEYKNPEAAKKQAIIDYEPAINYMEKKLDITQLDLTNEYVISQIYGSVLDPDISDEMRDDLFGLAAFVDIYETNSEEINVATVKAVGGTYNATKAVAYAKQYAKVPNLEYTFFVSGGDCTNFASQVLKAGGKIPNATWKPYTVPWINANSFVSLFRGQNEQDVGWTGNRGNSYNTKVGDIIAIDYASDGDYNHLMIVTGKGYTSTYGTVLYYSAHTEPRLDENFNQIFSESAKNKSAKMVSFTPR